MEWRRFSGEKLHKPIQEVVETTIFNEKDLGHRLKVCIGADSQVKGKCIEFALVVVFLREKKGGFMYFTTQRLFNPMTIKERMIHEVSMSVQLAYELCATLDKHNIELEVHADINTDPHFKSNVAFRDAMGYILGMGYVFKAKPHAFASSYCADRFVH